MAGGLLNLGRRSRTSPKGLIALRHQSLKLLEPKRAA